MRQAHEGHYSPEDIKKIKKGNLLRGIDVTALDEEERAARNNEAQDNLKELPKRVETDKAG